MSRRRPFPRGVKLAAWDRCEGADGKHYCECGCGLPISASDPAEYDHWPVRAEDDGPATLENCRVMRRSCHRTKTAKVDAPALAKGRSVRAGQANAKAPKRGFRGWRKFNGDPVFRE